MWQKFAFAVCEEKNVYSKTQNEERKKERQKERKKERKKEIKKERKKEILINREGQETWSSKWGKWLQNKNLSIAKARSLFETINNLLSHFVFVKLSRK